MPYMKGVDEGGQCDCWQHSPSRVTQLLRRDEIFRPAQTARGSLTYMDTMYVFYINWCLCAQSLTATVKCVCTRKTSESSSAFKIRFWAKAVNHFLTGRCTHLMSASQEAWIMCFILRCLYTKLLGKRKKKNRFRQSKTRYGFRTDLCIARPWWVSHGFKEKPLPFSERPSVKLVYCSQEKAESLHFFVKKHDPK